MLTAGPGAPGATSFSMGRGRGQDPLSPSSGRPPPGLRVQPNQAAPPDFPASGLPSLLSGSWEAPPPGPHELPPNVRNKAPPPGFPVPGLHQRRQQQQQELPQGGAPSDNGSWRIPAGQQQGQLPPPQPAVQVPEDPQIAGLPARPQPRGLAEAADPK